MWPSFWSSFIIETVLFLGDEEYEDGEEGGEGDLVDGQQVPDDDKIRQELQQRRCADSFSLDIRAGFDAAPAMWLKNRSDCQIIVFLSSNWSYRIPVQFF